MQGRGMRDQVQAEDWGKEVGVIKDLVQYLTFKNIILGNLIPKEYIRFIIFISNREAG